MSTYKLYVKLYTKYINVNIGNINIIFNRVPDIKQI